MDFNSILQAGVAAANAMSASQGENDVEAFESTIKKGLDMLAAAPAPAQAIAQSSVIDAIKNFAADGQLSDEIKQGALQMVMSLLTGRADISESVKSAITAVVQGLLGGLKA